MRNQVTVASASTELVFDAAGLRSCAVEIGNDGELYRDGERITIRKSVDLFKAAYEHGENGPEFGKGESFARWLELVRDALPSSNPTTFFAGGAN